MLDFSKLSETELQQIDLTKLTETELMNYGVRANWNKEKIEEAIKLSRIYESYSGTMLRLQETISDCDKVVAKCKEKQSVMYKLGSWFGGKNQTQQKIRNL